jgi:hypothetical protein
MKDLQKIGGMAALAAAATYVFAIALVATALRPMADPDLAFGDFMVFLAANETLVFVWHSVMYLINGVCLIVLALALRDRLAAGSPILSRVAAAFGCGWALLVILSGLVTNHGLGALVALYGEDPLRAESLKDALDAMTLGIDSSDRFLGALWIAAASAASGRGALPKPIRVFGLAIGAAGAIGTAVPALSAIAYAFGVGAILWWSGVGAALLCGAGRYAADACGAGSDGV